MVWEHDRGYIRRLCHRTPTVRTGCHGNNRFQSGRAKDCPRGLSFARRSCKGLSPWTVLCTAALQSTVPVVTPLRGRRRIDCLSHRSLPHQINDNIPPQSSRIYACMHRKVDANACFDHRISLCSSASYGGCTRVHSLSPFNPCLDLRVSCGVICAWFRTY